MGPFAPLSRLICEVNASPPAHSAHANKLEKPLRLFAFLTAREPRRTVAALHANNFLRVAAGTAFQD